MGLHRYGIDRKACSEEADVIHSAVVDFGPALSQKKPGAQNDFLVMTVRAAGVGGKPR